MIHGLISPASPRSVHRFSQEGSDNGGERTLHAFFSSVLISTDGTHNVQFLLYVYIWNSHFSPPEQMPSPFGVGPAHEKKIGHRRVDASGETTYKKAGVSSVSLFSPTALHPHLTLLFFTLFSTYRPPPLHCKGPSSWALVTLSARSAPSLKEMC